MVAILLLLFAPFESAHASWEFLPETRHELYQTYGLFYDQQSVGLHSGDGHLWASLAGTMALAGDPEAASHPQLVATAAANAGFHYNDEFNFTANTVDARAGFLFQFAWDESLRFSVGAVHESGHLLDGAPAQDLPDLYHPTVAQEAAVFRVLYDVDKTFRLGATFKPYFHSTPAMAFFAADQFAECFPWGAEDERKTFNPYLALGQDERGPQGHLTYTFHAQLGAYWGNHFSPDFKQTFRAVLGYYTGADPRLKYFELRDAKMEFFYLGFMFEI